MRRDPDQGPIPDPTAGDPCDREPVRRAVRDYSASETPAEHLANILQILSRPDAEIDGCDLDSIRSRCGAGLEYLRRQDLERYQGAATQRAQGLNRVLHDIVAGPVRELAGGMAS